MAALVLVVTADPVVHEQVRVAAASAGATCRAVADVAVAEASPAVLVVVDARLPGCWTGSPLVPDALLVVVDGSVPVPPGALELPAQRALLAERVALAVGHAAEGRAGPGEGLVVGVVGAVGGAGTSTLALALAAAGRGRLVDADPVRSGTAVVTGRGAPEAPVPGAGWGEDAPTPAALADDLDRARREAPLVVVDLATVASGTVWRRADAAVLVVPDAVAAALAARAAVRHLRSLVPRLVVVVRGRRRGGPGRAAVGEVVGAVPVVGWGRHEALAAAADAGSLDDAVRRGPTAGAARDVLGLLVSGP